jgi:hypothetical protein
MNSREKWEALLDKPQLVSFFNDIFSRIGVRVADTGEAFTAVHHGDSVSFEDGIDNVDYTVEISAVQVDRLAAEGVGGEFNEAEKFRIMRTLFTPATVATLKIPMLSSKKLIKLLGAENVIHSYLISPIAGDVDYCHTLIYINGEWMAIPGAHGTPVRTYRMTVDDAIEYQKMVFSAMQTNSWSGWVELAKWYKDWRKSVSVSA